MGRTGRVCALTAYHAHHRMTSVRQGASLEASTASTASPAAGAIVAALARAGTRLMFGVPGGGPNLDMVGAAEAAGGRFVPGPGGAAGTGMGATRAGPPPAPGGGGGAPGGGGGRAG